jgi:hypothetical protein
MLGLTIGIVSLWTNGSQVGLGSVAPIRGIEVSESPLPPLGVPHYQSSGTYLRVFSSEISVRAVNEALQGSALANERVFAMSARDEERRLGKTVPLEPGRYTVTPDRHLISASSVVVSALIPVLEAYPAGVPDEVWQSQTVEVPSGRPVVNLETLFSDPQRALSVVADATYGDVVSGKSVTDLCVQQVQGHRVAGGPAPGGFAPTAANYKYFALIATGVAIGIPQGAVASDACGRVEVTIPYSVLDGYFNSLGRLLASGSRQPSSMG